MKDLKAEIIELEAKVAAFGGSKKPTGVKRPTQATYGNQEEHRSKQRKTTTTSTTPPSPSLSPERQPRQSLISESPDPNETESEAGLPPPLTVASRSSSHPSITSLLNSSNHAHSQGQYIHRPSAPPEATNPTLYLPFPTPSPTSPFLTYSASNTSTSTAMEPSPFIAPLNNFSLFGGAIPFDPNSPEVSMGMNRPPPELSMPPPKGSEKEKRIPSPEEAANLLLAFSSPDTLRPVHGGTPVFAPAVAGRRATLDSDDFMLDGVGIGRGGAQVARGHGHGQWSRGMVGKTAKDFLRM
jgi:hypothetical protein